VLPYYALASGFLTGKYRPGSAEVDSPRAQRAGEYLAKGGGAALEALDQVAAARQTTPAAVALAWLLTRPHVVAPIASARSTGQLAEILPAVKLELTPEETGLLSSATEPA
jgi:aryl-alcohol dehydrogenase (NADP+)